MVALDDDTEAEALSVAEADRIDDARSIELLTKLVRAENDGDAILEMLLATSPGSGETLKSYVDRVYGAESDEERAATYQKMLDSRRRIIPQIRAALRAEGRAA